MIKLFSKDASVIIELW